jgi:Flp pilus assembly pilin Flp
MKQIIAKFIADEQGQDIIEYALLGSFVSFGAYVGATNLGQAYDAWFGRIKSVVDSANVVGAPAAP